MRYYSRESKTRYHSVVLPGTELAAKNQHYGRRERVPSSPALPSTTARSSCNLRLSKGGNPSILHARKVDATGVALSMASGLWQHDYLLCLMYHVL